MGRSRSPVLLMLPRLLRQNRLFLFYLTSFAVILSAFISCTIVATTYAKKSKDPEFSPFFRKLIPGGTSACQTESIFQCESCLDCSNTMVSYDNDTAVDIGWEFVYGRDDKNLALNEAQCNAAFPGLFEEINRAVAFHNDDHITPEQLAAIKAKGMINGMVHVLIKDKQLYVLASNHRDHDQRRKGLAILASIHRSISSIPHDSPIPDVEFIFTIEDYAPDATLPILTLTRRPEDTAVWLMPDFAFWSWAIEDLGTFDTVVEQIKAQERDFLIENNNCGFECKIPKAVWRGSIDMSPILRRDLLAAAKGKEWSDIEDMRNDGWGTKANHIHVVEQCDYMFNVHAEGRSYSGSLKYRQICRSVTLIHQLQWIQHHHPLLVSSGPHQNFVPLYRNFTDLAEKIEFLLLNPQEASRIADNSVKVFRERYLTMAAEACYWRLLLKGWADVTFVPGRELGRKSGVRFETYSIWETEKQMKFNVGATDI